VKGLVAAAAEQTGRGAAAAGCSKSLPGKSSEKGIRSSAQKIIPPAARKERPVDMVEIRKAHRKDIEAMAEIYNEAVLHTTATFDTAPRSVAAQASWFEEHGDRYPVLVAEEGGAVVGWASLSRWSERCAYTETVESSLYVREGFQGRGIGKALLPAVLDKGSEAGFHTVLAQITEDNEKSIHLHEALGFAVVGVMQEVGRKFGKLLNVALMQKIYKR